MGKIVTCLILWLCIALIFGGEINETLIVRSVPSHDAILPCEVSSSSSQLLIWTYAKDVEIGSYDVKNDYIDIFDEKNVSYRIHENGSLHLYNVGRHLVEKYTCIAVTPVGNFTSDVLFRLDYSAWYTTDTVFDSVFWGAGIFAVIFCAASFVLNILWIIGRKTSLWWINRTERLSRVRCMLESIEKYRQRQMESLHETYHRRVAAIRENYHQQVEQLRTSYANQADRIRDYRQAQIEHFTQHLDNIRDNYNQQLGRLREFGARRTETLWENYERQLNRMRTFTLQQRLKLMRQYKVKQRYINKLLESIAESNNPDAINKKEAAIRAVLEIPDHPFPPNLLSRSSSFHSLPGYIIESHDEIVASSSDSKNVSKKRSFTTDDEKIDQEAQAPLTSRSFNELRNLDN